MRRIAIQDANILIDLVKTGLFDHCMTLEYQFSSTDIVFDELYPDQQAIVAAHIQTGRFIIIQIPPAELERILILNEEGPRLSIQDCSALYYSLEKNCILLTGDKRMREFAKKKAIEYYGMFWVLDQLLENSIITKVQALEFLEKLMLVNKRLPNDEYVKRKTAWQTTD